MTPTLIERFAEGTPAIPHPHRLFSWANGRRSMMVALPLEAKHEPPIFRGWHPTKLVMCLSGSAHWEYRPL